VATHRSFTRERSVGRRFTASVNAVQPEGFPTSAGILLGLGLGGFFDGIVPHQVLQWHHMLTDAGYPVTSVENLKINTFWDGLFHATTYIFIAMGLIVLWGASRGRHIRWSTKLLAGTLLIGFGLFNLVEGIVDLTCSASTMSTRQCRGSSGSSGMSAS
jgi:uncharacterized membrane protein